MRWTHTITMAVCFAALVCQGSVLLGDWDPGDPVKMEYPQLPGPNWDCGFYFKPSESLYGRTALADDWTCSQSGPVSDIHFWYSWKDEYQVDITMIEAKIYSNGWQEHSGGDRYVPGELLWEDTFEAGDFSTRLYDTGSQRFFIPEELTTWGTLENPNHTNVYQCNIEDIVSPFTQAEGTVYWLALNVYTDPQSSWNGGNPLPAIGWHLSSIMNDDFDTSAVYQRYDEWFPIPNPEGTLSGDPYDFYPGPELAFVITPEPGSLTILALSGLVLLRRRNR
ncbi:MAG: hypothetical protein ACP5HU_06850 [Phycisphaerae bacterium]